MMRDRELLLHGAFAALALCACAGPPGNQVFVPDPPSTDGFSLVADALDAHCGTLDCHGSPARNFRVYGIDGERLSRNDIPGGSLTTAAEYTATYESIIALEPEILSSIVAEGGAHPERWIVITKGRGTEAHKGGHRMTAGDDTDRCITTWLAGSPDANACTNAAAVLPPGGIGF
jgi:hypothetical protein